MAKRVCLVTTSVLIVRFFLIPHLRRLSERYDVTLVVNTENVEFLREYRLGVRVLPIAIERQVSPIRDLLALVRLTALFRRERFDAVHSFSPKGGLLAMLAARIARIPVRMHTFTGQVWANRSGPMRALLKLADRITARAATWVFADSVSQREFMQNEGVLPPSGQCEVLAGGSITGVDVRRFHPDPDARRAVREELALPQGGAVFMYAGRLTRDKGIFDLARAFSIVAEREANAYLVLVGPDEEALAPAVQSLVARYRDRLRFHGFTPTIERYLAAADVLCLPSYREGFGAVIIEAAACGVPCCASRIYGITDAVIEGVTGLLHAPGDERDLASLMLRMATQQDLLDRLGTSARARAVREFSEDQVVGALVGRYRSILGE
jgi:glycosyltransferase involved in cell wall biosynthesis